MITHSEAITAWEEVFQPSKKQEISIPCMYGVYKEYVNIPIRPFVLDVFPFKQTISSSHLPVVENMASLYVYFKGLSERKVQNYLQAQRIWLNLFPHIPERYRTIPEYQKLLEYFSQTLSYTPIDRKTGRSLRYINNYRIITA